MLIVAFLIVYLFGGVTQTYAKAVPDQAACVAALKDAKDAVTAGDKDHKVRDVRGGCLSMPVPPPRDAD